MIKYFRIFTMLATMFLVACGTGIPTENLPSYRYFERANTSEAITKQDIRDCHLGVRINQIVTEMDADYEEMNRRWIENGGGDQLVLTDDQYIQGHLCMYAKGYYEPKFEPICDNPNYKRYSACQEYLQKKK